MSKMPRLYIAGPYSGGDQIVNVRNAVLAGEAARALGWSVYIPHLNALWHAIAPHDWEFWLRHDLEWLEACDALLRLPGESVGADREVVRAAALGVLIIGELVRPEEVLP